MGVREVMMNAVGPGLVFAGFDWQGLVIALIGVILAQLTRYFNEGGKMGTAVTGAAVAGGGGLLAANMMSMPTAGSSGWEQIAIAALSFLLTWLSRPKKQ